MYTVIFNFQKSYYIKVLSLIAKDPGNILDRFQAIIQNSPALTLRLGTEQLLSV